MADPQRTQKATPKRVREFRKRGEIALSRDIVSAATLAGGSLALFACIGMAVTAIAELARTAATAAADGGEANDLASSALHAFLLASVPVMIGAAAASLVAVLVQLGWPPAWKPIGFDLSRMSPIKNLGSMFAPASLARRVGTAVAKLVAIGGILVLVLRDGIATHGLDATTLGAVAWGLIHRALMFVLLAFAALAAVDYVMARRRMTAQMKMTADEVKRDHREQDGDPMVKGRRRVRMRELAKRRLAAAVAKADVVVVNPTHYAVALRYDEHKDRAPVVVAKGVDESAEKIREVARKHGVPVLERPPLARALHKHVKEGRAIPANLYRAVAEVLAYVYRLRATAAGGSR